MNESCERIRETCLRNTRKNSTDNRLLHGSCTYECITTFYTPNVSGTVLAFVGILNGVDCQDLETHLASQLKLAMVSLRFRSE